jgi:hypothetical protein
LLFVWYAAPGVFGDRLPKIARLLGHRGAHRIL